MEATFAMLNVPKTVRLLFTIRCCGMAEAAHENP
jgi:hypothetical protein